MTNARYVDIENECLRRRLQEQRDAMQRLCETVRRYTRGECLRSELLNTVTDTEQVAQGGGRKSRVQPRTHND